MLTDEEIADESWREDLDKLYGWMGGPTGLYFEMRGGWRLILEDMLRRFEMLLAGEDRESFQISQIKEKLGTLRCYTNGDDRIELIVQSAEAASAVTCEICGGRGHIRGGGWLSVRCDEHVDSRM